MKKILLIGDSIRLGYDRYVKESMQNMAEVYYPAENCRFSTNILRTLHYWCDDLGLYECDAVLWNAGLWDTLRIYGDEPLISEATYAENVLRITNRIQQLFPNAKIIFATSTPVDESGYIPDFEMRYNRDVARYNEIAKEVLAPTGTQILDLCELMKDHPEMHSDPTHFYTEGGTLRIGGAVNHTLCETLGLNEAALTPPDPKGFVRSDIPNDTGAYEKRGNVYALKRTVAVAANEV